MVKFSINACPIKSSVWYSYKIIMVVGKASVLMFVSCCFLDIDLDKGLRLRVADDHVSVCVMSSCLLCTCV